MLERVLALFFASLLPFASTTKAANSLKCEPSFELYGRWCYQFSSSQFPVYDTSNAYCQPLSAEMVSIHDAQENGFIASKANKNGTYIGLKVKADKKLEWLDETPVDYTNFGSSFRYDEPDDVLILPDGTWVNDRKAGAPFVCKKKPFNVPESSPTSCPSPAAIYKDDGALFSPGFPSTFNGELHCYYHLLAPSGDYVVFQLTEQGFFADGVMNFYDGYVAKPEYLITTKRFADEIPVITTKSNKMLVEFINNASSTGYWQAEWYSRGTTPVGAPAALKDVTRPCPKINNIIQSPNYPGTYEANYDCIIDLPAEKRNCTQPGDVTQRSCVSLFEFVELDLGDDDWIYLIDQKFNTVYESSQEDLVAGIQFALPFNTTFWFHSGSKQTTSNRYNILVVEHEVLEWH